MSIQIDELPSDLSKYLYKYVSTFFFQFFLKKISKTKKICYRDIKKQDMLKNDRLVLSGLINGLS